MFVSDLRTQLESTLGAAYTIERELGGGGMARVFLATDRALARRVVIKVLSPELSAELSAKRFAREIRLAASLQQANIVPVLSAGEANGIAHYVMPFVEGLSLRDRLDRDPRATLEESVGILRDVARALAYAHDRGVVHRDIKPDNILLSGDAAVVTDFGVAKALAVAKIADSDPSGAGPARAESTVTHVGMAVGTPAYMSPEQVTADPTVDHRADIYSFGCVAYELLSGAPPFGLRVLPALFAAHLSQRPTPLADKNPALPQALTSVVMRCLEKDPADRPQSAREIIASLATLSATESTFARLTRRLSPRKRRGLAVAGSIVAASIVASLLIRGAANRPPALSTIAVIPLLNASGDSAHEYLADGISDELATALGKVEGIRVTSRSLGFRYKGRRDLDEVAIGRALSVNHVLHGQVRRAGDRLRISVRLISVRDSAEVWAESYERNAGDAYQLQHDITRAVAAKLGKRLAAGPTRGGTSDAVAHDLYLRGRFLLLRRGAGVRQSVDNFEQAIARDSSFALAHAAHALALELLPYFEEVDAREIGRRAIASARRALALDSTLAEALTALAMAYQHQYQWRTADEYHRRAVAFNPFEPDAHIQYGRFLWYTGRVAEAEPQFSRARELDPYSAVASAWHGYLLFLRGKQEEGIAELRRGVDLDSTNFPASLFLAGVYRRLGKESEARAVSERLRRSVPQWRGAGLDLEEPDQMNAAIQRLAARPQNSPAASSRLAFAYIGIGDSTRFFEHIERATLRGEIWPTWYSLSDPRFDFVRRSGRFAAIVRSVGLDERIFTSATGGRVQ